jgi:hypothetical protein
MFLVQGLVGAVSVMKEPLLQTGGPACVWSALMDLSVTLVPAAATLSTMAKIAVAAAVVKMTVTTEVT